MSGITLLWFKRDLRIHDHPALIHATGLGLPILPLYIVEPDYWHLPDSSGRQWAFVRESLEELRADLAGLGAPLVIRTGEAVETLSDLHRTHTVRHLVSHEETGNAWTYARDLKVGAWARDAGIGWHELPQSGVVRLLKNRDRWTAQRRVFTGTPPLAPRPAITRTGEDPGPIPNLALADDPCPGRQAGGRRAGVALLTSFLTERGEGYQRQMSSPISGETACSRLSPHLAFGTLSGREAHHAKLARAGSASKGSQWGKSLRSFEARLAWRDHFMQKLEDEPEIEQRCMHPAYEGLRPKTPDQTRLAAWANGETGLPFVDACMRYTRATGWLNFRMRSMVTATAAYHLWLDWRAFGPILARYFTDYEPGIHWSQLQMQSGVTGINTIRLYNPVKQGHDQDPTGTFTRRWCPELAEVPLTHLQTPWTWEHRAGLLDKTYPSPIVDIASAARTAKDAVYAVRRDPDFRAQAAAVVKKHASRKHPGSLFQRDAVPDIKPTPVAQQLSFDL